MTVNVELFASPACTRCAQAKRKLQRLVETVGDDRLEWRAIDVLDEIDYAVALGVLSIPAIAINGVLVFSKLPSTKELRCVLIERLATDAAAGR